MKRFNLFQTGILMLMVLVGFSGLKAQDTAAGDLPPSGHPKMYAMDPIGLLRGEQVSILIANERANSATRYIMSGNINRNTVNTTVGLCDQIQTNLNFRIGLNFELDFLKYTHWNKFSIYYGGGGLIGYQNSVLESRDGFFTSGNNATMGTEFRTVRNGMDIAAFGLMGARYTFGKRISISGEFAPVSLDTRLGFSNITATEVDIQNCILIPDFPATSEASDFNVGLNFLSRARVWVGVHF